MNDPETTRDQATHPWRQRLVGFAFRAVVTTLARLPGWLAYGLADMLVPVLILITVYNRRRADRKHQGFYFNTRVVFRGELTGTQRRRLLWRWARHMVHLGVDICKMPEITADNMAEYCDLTDIAKMRKHYDRSRGILIASAHMGVYEYSPHLITLNGMPLLTVFRESPIPPVTDVLNRIRTSGGQRMTERAGAVREMLRWLAQGNVSGVMYDISAKENSGFAPFLGTMAATNNTLGLLHLRTKAPIQVVTTHRVSRRRYKFHVWDTIEHEQTGDREADLAAIAKRVNAAISRAICHDPEQWFWDSRRFRTRPDGEEQDEWGLPPQIEPDQLAKVLASRQENPGNPALVPFTRAR